MQRVKGVEIFFLRALASGQELDVVDQEHVHGAIALAELVGLAFLNGLNHVVGEPLAGRVDHGLLGEHLAHPMADGVQQVGLAQADAAPDKERIPRLARSVGGGHGRGMRQPVAGAHDKGLEDVVGRECRLGLLEE